MQLSGVSLHYTEYKSGWGCNEYDTCICSWQMKTKLTPVSVSCSSGTQVVEALKINNDNVMYISGHLCVIVYSIFFTVFILCLCWYSYFLFIFFLIFQLFLV